MVARSPNQQMTLGKMKVRSWEIDFSKLLNVTRKVTLSMVLVSLLPVSFAPIEGKIKTDADLSQSLEVSFNQASPVLVDYKLSTITPGESVIEKQARLEAEAKARAEAEAEAKAKAEAVAKAAQRNTISRGHRVYNDPSNFDEIYQRAGQTYGVSPALLKAVHIVETGASGSTSKRNPSGATGPMQFLSSTFRRYGVDGNGDGITDICNVEDAIFSAARYLKACGYPNIEKCLWGYNPSASYCRKVRSIAGL
jgi:membrane-bound lytic murein transglycosylase B